MPEGGIIAAFRTRPTQETLAEFEALYAEMSAIVSAMPGYAGHKVFTADDGEMVVIAEWTDREAFLAWDKHPDHERAKELGMPVMEVGKCGGGSQLLSHPNKTTL